MLQDGVVADVAFNFGAAALDQGAVALKRLDQLQDAADIIRRGFAQAFQLFVDDHGAYAVMHIDLQQQRAVEGKRHDVAAFNARLAGLDAILQVKTGIAGLLRPRQAGEQFFCLCQRQFRIDRIVITLRFARAHPNARYFRHKNQLVSLQRDRHTGRDFFHAQVEGFPGGRKTKRGQQHHGAHVKCALDARHIDLAHQARVLEIDAVQNADRTRGNEIARQDTYRRAGHGCVGQALAERCLDFVAQLAGRLLGTVERHPVGDAHAV